MQTPGPYIGPGAFGNVGDFHGRDMDKALYAYGSLAGFLVGGYIVRPIVVGTVRSVPTLKNAWRIYKYGVGQYVAYHEMVGLLPALGPDHELAIGYGVEGTTTLGEEFEENLPMGHWYALPYYYNIPIPDFGVAITSVPVYRPPLDQSREGVEDTSLYRDHDTSPSIGGPLGTPTHLLPKWFGPSSKRSPGSIFRGSGMTKGDSGVRRGARTRTRPWWFSTKAKRRISRKRS